MYIDTELLIAAALGAAVCLGHGSAQAQTIEVSMHHVDSTGVLEPLGTVTIAGSPGGVMFTPALAGLAPGQHGFHIHDKPDCAPAVDPASGTMSAAFAAGSHWDPEATKRHRGPHEEGHLGDLPLLVVDADGTATTAVLAPRLRLEALTGHALVIHAGADNYSDAPQKLGGGGARVACGIIEAIRTTLRW
ncbi:MAG: superoxide dismutase [Cu-Zn] SodC [Betaproteobacteria bacterium]